MNDSYVYDEEMKRLEILIDDVHYRYLFDVELMEDALGDCYSVMAGDVVVMCRVDKRRMR